MTLHELFTTLKNLEGVGANKGERGGSNRRIVCQVGYRDFDIDSVEIKGGDVVLRLSDEEL